jgi:DNA helicase-4
MPANQTQLVIHPSFLGRLFGAKETVFTATKDGVEISHSEGTFTVLSKDLKTHIEGARGTIFYRIYAKAKDGDYTFRWLSSTAVLEAISFIDKAFYGYYAISVAALQKETKEYINEQYPTKAFWKSTRRSSKWLQKLYNELPPEDMLTKKQYSAFKFVDGVASGAVTLDAAQASYAKKQLRQYKDFFDKVESNPLTDKQRLACVVNEENNLVLAGAGSGKTSVMIGRVGYLLESQQATADEILMLAFGNKAAAEMSERILDKLKIDTVKASTFHSLGQQIISEVEAGKPSVSSFATDTLALDQFLEKSFHELMEQDAYKAVVVRHFLYFRFEPINPFAYKHLADYNRAVKDNDLRTNQGELVKGYQELLIANFLYKNNIEYEYEAKYQLNTKTLEFRQYQPDFYLPESGVYIEHYGVDRDGNTAPYVDTEKYIKSIEWKRTLHEGNNTQCIETFHYEWTDGNLLQRLEDKLSNVGVSLNPLTNDQIIEKLASAQDRPLDELCSLLGTMLKLFKASNMNGELFSPGEQTLAPTTFFQKIFERILLLFADKQPNATNINRMKSAQKLMMPLYMQYENYLAEHNEIDFDDMINKAIKYVESGQFTSPWKHIMVDEFQDISSSRAQLIIALRDQVKHASLFCVGDDWQSVYRFAGSDLSYVTAFKKHFGVTQTTTLDKTFRFNNSICDIASYFVSRNPEQIDKDISTHLQVSEPAVSLFRTDDGNDTMRLANLEAVLKAISARKSESTILILGRYAFTLPDRHALVQFEKDLGNVHITAMTIHASKGKEADYVIVMGLEDGKLGFPSEKQEHPLIEALMPPSQPFPFAEERRLFYVAITRAKQRAYLISDMKKPSSFVLELLNENYPIELNEFGTADAQAVFESVKCPVCQVGRMVPRKGQHGDFYGCSCYPRCNHIENGCKECGSVMQRTETHKVCTDGACQCSVPLCPECNAELVYRKGRNGNFWGCKNYRTEGLSCGYTVNNIETPPLTEFH